MERDSALFGAIRHTLKNILRLYLSDSAYSSLECIVRHAAKGKLPQPLADL